MAIDIGSFFQSICNKTYSVTGLNAVFSSVINMAIILSIIIILLIMTIYPCKKGTPIYILGKLFLYVLLISVSLLSLHSSIIKNDYQQKYSDQTMGTFINKIGGKNEIYREDMVEIKPQYSDDRGFGEVESQPEPDTINGMLNEMEFN